MSHIPVLLQETIDGLDVHPNDVFVDGTFGAGGHMGEVIRRLGDKVKIFAIDADGEALVRGKGLGLTSNVTFIRGNFRAIDELLRSHGVDAADKILLDIGFSSDQLEGRGLSFRENEPLDMRFDDRQALTARTIVNEWDEETLRLIIRAWGEERWAGRIAKAIIHTRALAPIETTADLAEIVLSSTPGSYHRGRLHPATRTFQALRIAVNDELVALEEGIQKSFTLLRPHGRLAVISFHSLEDRIVKDHFKAWEEAGLGTRVTRKPITAKESERESNPRSRSAKLRVIEKI